MASHSQTFAKGASINRPHLFAWDNYIYFFGKLRWKFFLNILLKGVWDAVVNCPFEPNNIVDHIVVPKECSDGLLMKTNEHIMM